MDSSSAVDEDTSQTLTKLNKSKTPSKKRWLTGEEKIFAGDEAADGDEDGEECDAEAWETLSKSFREAQSVLDQNRALIQQVNENHQSKIHDNLVKNVALIREINGNISKVSSLYSNLSVNFANVVHQRRSKNIGNNNNGDDKVASVD